MTMLVINTAVVRALLVLKGLTRKTLAKAAGVREDNLRAWLSNAQAADLCLARKNQILVLRALGIDEDTPRSDTVHAWYLDESSGRKRDEGIAALQVLLSAYGSASVTYFGPDSDSPFSLSERVHFGLRFSAFRAILTVTPGFLREIKFSPELLKELKWADTTPVCMLPEIRFEQIVNADVTSGEFDDLAKGQVETAKWESILLLAREHNISPEYVASWMFELIEKREEKVALASSHAPVPLEHVDPAITEVLPLPVGTAAEPVVVPVVATVAPAISEAPTQTADVMSITEHALFQKRS